MHFFNWFFKVHSVVVVMLDGKRETLGILLIRSHTQLIGGKALG